MTGVGDGLIEPNFYGFRLLIDYIIAKIALIGRNFTSKCQTDIVSRVSRLDYLIMATELALSNRSTYSYSKQVPRS